jgi:hypothetical protein
VNSVQTLKVKHAMRAEKINSTRMHKLATFALQKMKSDASLPVMRARTGSTHSASSRAHVSAVADATIEAGDGSIPVAADAVGADLVITRNLSTAGPLAAVKAAADDVVTMPSPARTNQNSVVVAEADAITQFVTEAPKFTKRQRSITRTTAPTSATESTSVCTLCHWNAGTFRNRGLHAKAIARHVGSVHLGQCACPMLCGWVGPGGEWADHAADCMHNATAV